MILSGPSAKALLGLVAAGWLANALASTNSDIDAGIAAYEAGDHDAALAAYAAAEATLGERPELHYDRGLALLAKDDREAARKAFEHGTESDDPRVRASAEYELGNLDFDASAWDAAIERYTNCLKQDPSHQSAKWNLELALLKKKQEEEEKKKEEQEKQDDENKDDENKDDENKDDENKDDENKDDENKDDENKDEKDKDEQDKDEKDKDDENKDEQDKDENKDQGDQNKDEQDKGQQDQPQPQPQPMDRADLDKALEQLDAEDDFFLGRPVGRQVPVEKDW
ncbi:MAG: hypothetical protein R3B09_00565 [Nannocystaceae bacterium]